MQLPDPRTLIPDLLSSERDRFILWLPVLLGIGIGWYFALEAEPDVWLLASITGTCAVLLLLLRKTYWLRLMVIALLAVSFGLLLPSLRTHAVSAPYLYSTQYFKEVTGRIDQIAIREADQKIYIGGITIEGIKPETTPARVSIALRKPAPHLRVGDEIKVQAMLFPPPQPAMPGAFDFGRKFYFEKLGGVGYTPYIPEVTKPAEINNFSEWLTDLRLRTAARIRSVMEPDSGAVAAAIMVGDQASVSSEVRDAMRDSGLYHVLSISGLHMTLAVGVLYVALRFLFSLYMPLAVRWPIKKIAAGLGLLGAFCYLLLAGYPVPAVRSFIMVACVMLAILVDRRGITVFSLAWAALIILLIWPESLVGASFQLSFAATLAIVVLYERYGRALQHSNYGWFRTLRLYFLGLMATSLVATLATTPLTIHLFNRMTIWGLGANMLMMPLASFWIMPAAVLSFIAMPFGLERWPLELLELGIGWMIDVSRWFAALPYAGIMLPPLTQWGMLLVVFGGLWLCLWEKRWKWLGVPMMLIGMSSIALFEPYDLVVNREGKRIMARMPDGQFVFLRGEVDSFESELWLQSMGLDSALSLKDIKDHPFAAECNKNRCHIDMYGTQVAAAIRKEAPDLCDQPADIAIYERYLGDRQCENVPLKLDKKFLRANGAAALRLHGDTPQLDVVATSRGGRPWGANAYWPLYNVPAKAY